jgi:GNAT superfamily N-acetyltransferase
MITPMSAPVSIRAITDPADPAIVAFGRLQNQVYAEPEQLIPATYLPSMLTHHSLRQHNFMIVAEAEGEVIGGTVFHLFTEPSTGFSSFMAVAVPWRGQGVARMLHEARFALLDQQAHTTVNGLFIDVVNPERLTREHLQREQRVGSDPRARLRAFARLGFKRVDVRYEQPVGGPGGGPVTIMDLLYCPRQPAGHVATELVTKTMQGYWRSWLGPARAEKHALELENRAASDTLRLLPLL